MTMTMRVVSGMEASGETGSARTNPGERRWTKSWTKWIQHTLGCQISVQELELQTRWQVQVRPAILIDASQLAKIVEAAKGGGSQGKEQLANALIKVTETLRTTLEEEDKKQVRDGQDELKVEEKVLIDQEDFTINDDAHGK